MKISFVGYDGNAKRFRVLDVLKASVGVSCDVVFFRTSTNFSAPESSMDIVQGDLMEKDLQQERIEDEGVEELEENEFYDANENLWLLEKVDQQSSVDRHAKPFTCQTIYVIT